MNALIQSAVVAAGALLGCHAASTSDATAGFPEPRTVMRNVADAVLRDFPEARPFDWGEGVLPAEMMRAYDLTREERYLAFVRKSAAHGSDRGITALATNKGYPVLSAFGGLQCWLYLRNVNFEWAG